MIYIITGKPGSGKTFFTSLDIRFWLREGYIVLSNIVVYPLTIRFLGKTLYSDVRDFEEKYFYLNEDFEVEELLYFSKEKLGNKIIEGKIKLVLDEVLTLITRRQYVEQGLKKKFIRFLTQHRKYGYDVYMISQSIKDIDGIIRSLVDINIKYMYVHEVIPFVPKVNLRLKYVKSLNNNDFYDWSFLYLANYFGIAYKLYESYKVHLRKNEIDINVKNKNILSFYEVQKLLSPLGDNNFSGAFAP